MSISKRKKEKKTMSRQEEFDFGRDEDTKTEAELTTAKENMILAALFILTIAAGAGAFWALL